MEDIDLTMLARSAYARRQYYNTSTTRSYDSRRGGMWFERMKTAHRTQILKLVNK